MVAAKYPLRGSFLGENALLMLEIREWPLVRADRKATVIQILFTDEVCGKASLNMRNQGYKLKRKRDCTFSACEHN